MKANALSWVVAISQPYALSRMRLRPPTYLDNLDWQRQLFLGAKTLLIGLRQPVTGLRTEAMQ